jgi:ADP-ribose pyrophosphatase YjhB (NUDIX family)
MVRVKGGTQNHKNHKKVLALAKGYRMSRHRLIKVATQEVLHAGQYAFVCATHDLRDIITDVSGRVLLTKRAFDPGKGKWDLPGGFIDCEETAEESVLREAQEELGVELDDIKYMNSGYDRYVFKGMNYHTLGFVFTAKIRGAQIPQPHDDVSEIRYFSREEIDMDALAFPVLRTTLEYFWDKKAQ